MARCSLVVARSRGVAAAYRAPSATCEYGARSARRRGKVERGQRMELAVRAMAERARGSWRGRQLSHEISGCRFEQGDEDLESTSLGLHH